MSAIGISGSATLTVGGFPVSGSNPVPISGNITASNAAVGAIGSAAPTSADFIGVVDGSGNLRGVGASNPVRVDPTGTTSQPVELYDSSGNGISSTTNYLNVYIKGGSSSGTQYTDGTAESANAFTITVAGLYNGTDVVGLRGDASNNLYVNLHTAIPAGTNVIGHVITDSGSTTAVTGNVAVTGTFWQTTQPVSGTVAVSNFPATQPVSGTFWQATQPVSGTFWQATQPVSGTFWQATQPVSGSVSVSNFPATQPISGTVAVSNLPSSASTIEIVREGSPSTAVEAQCVDIASVAGVGVTSQGVPHAHVILNTIQDWNGVLRPIQRKAINASTSGTATLVSAVPGQSIYVFSWWISNGATANNFNLQSHTTTANSSGVVNMPVNGGAVYGWSDCPYIITSPGEALDTSLSGSSQVNGQIVYCQF